MKQNFSKTLYSPQKTTCTTQTDAIVLGSFKFLLREDVARALVAVG
jgi:hypothetical protein